MIIHNLEQGSPEWLEKKCGKFSSSDFSKLLMAKTTKGYNEYIDQVVYERITNEKVESYSNKDMERGLELEPEAIEAYELGTFNRVDRLGFIELSEWVGCSPDGLIGADGMVQIKCPKWNTQLAYLRDSKLLIDSYYAQVQGEMMVSGRAWSDLFAYHPRLNCVLVRVDRDEKFIELLTKEIATAIDAAQERINFLKGK